MIQHQHELLLVAIVEQETLAPYARYCAARALCIDGSG